jgi:hypothetical protein
MTLRVRHFFIAALVLYWPLIFLMAHMPNVPAWILRTQMSDKALHYLGYLMLVYLWWFSIFPSQRPSFFSRSLWFTIAMMLVYAASDEWLQRFTHRTPDILDLAADMAGVATGLLIFGVAGLRLSSLGITTACIVVLTSLCKADPLGFVPFLDILFYVFAYGLVTLLWANYLWKDLKLSRGGFTVLSLLLPAILLMVTSLIASMRGKHFEISRLIASVAGIAVFFTVYFLFLIYTADRRSE